LWFSHTRLSDVLHRQACAFFHPAVIGIFYKPYLYVELVAKPGVARFPSFDLVPFAQICDKPLFYMALDADQ
jgi:hypothetical protein